MKKIILPAILVIILVGVLLFWFYQKQDPFKNKIYDEPIDTNRMIAVDSMSKIWQT